MAEAGDEYHSIVDKMAGMDPDQLRQALEEAERRRQSATSLADAVKSTPRKRTKTAKAQGAEAYLATSNDAKPTKAKMATKPRQALSKKKAPVAVPTLPTSLAPQLFAPQGQTPRVLDLFKAPEPPSAQRRSLNGHRFSNDGEGVAVAGLLQLGCMDRMEEQCGRLAALQPGQQVAMQLQASKQAAAANTPAAGHGARPAAQQPSTPAVATQEAQSMDVDNDDGGETTEDETEHQKNASVAAEVPVSSNVASNADQIDNSPPIPTAARPSPSRPASAPILQSSQPETSMTAMTNMAPSQVKTTFATEFSNLASFGESNINQAQPFSLPLNISSGAAALQAPSQLQLHLPFPNDTPQPGTQPMRSHVPAPTVEPASPADTHADDQYDDAGDQVETATKFTGVRQNKGGRFSARIKIGGSNRYIGTFKTADEAARAFDAVAIQFGRPVETLNFPANHGGPTVGQAYRKRKLHKLYTDPNNHINLLLKKLADVDRSNPGILKLTMGTLGVPDSRFVADNKYSGVRQQTNHWEARIRYKDKLFSMGFYSSVEAAALAWDITAASLRRCSKLNFPEVSYADLEQQLDALKCVISQNCGDEEDSGVEAGANDAGDGSALPPLETNEAAAAPSHDAHADVAAAEMESDDSSHTNTKAIASQRKATGPRSSRIRIPARHLSE